MITVKDWMSKPVITVRDDSTVFDMVVLMNRHNIGSIVVSNDGKHAHGIVTERDILHKIIEEERSPREVIVSEVMTKDVITVEVDTSLLEISKLMTKNVMRRIVITEKNVIIGIVTSRDLLQLMAG